MSRSVPPNDVERATQFAKSLVIFSVGRKMGGSRNMDPRGKVDLLYGNSRMRRKVSAKSWSGASLLTQSKCNDCIALRAAVGPCL
jgi:hypothetical protein